MPIVLRTLLGASLLTISLATLLGCLHPTPTPVSAGGDFCDIAKPISYCSEVSPCTPKDSRQTIAEILSHNAAGCAVCQSHPVWAPKCVAPKPMAPVP